MSKHTLAALFGAMVVLIGCAKKAPLTPTTPWADVRDDALSFLTIATDPAGLKMQYIFDWGNGDTTTTTWYKSGDTARCPRSFPDTGTFHIKVKARNEAGRSSKWSDECLFRASRPPQLVDTIVGLPRWAVDRWYRPSVKVTDPDGDSVSVKFIWGDSMASNWSQFVASGSTVTDSVKWQTTGRHVIHILLKDKGSMVNASAGAKFINVSAFALLWSNEDLDLWGTSPVLGEIDGDVVLYTFLNDGLACFSSDGQMRWSSPTRVDMPLYAPSLSADGSHLYYTDDNFGLFCLDARTGAQVWNIDTLYGHNCTPAVGPGKSVYVSSGLSNNRVVKVKDLGPTATVEWTSPLCQDGMAQIAVTASGGVYAVTDVYGSEPPIRVWALDSSGALLWQDSTHLRFAEYPIDLAVDSRGRLIVGDEDDSLFCFNSDGTIAWRHFVSYLYPGGVTIGYGDRVYVHDDERFYCLNSDGTEVWTAVSEEAWPDFNSVCALADSSILAYDNNAGCLVDIDYDGEVRWFYYFEDSLGLAARRRPGRDEGYECATPAVGPDGNVYLDGGDYLWCFACGDARLANTAWPTYNHDNARSGWAGRH